MAKTKFSLDFDGFLNLAETLDKMGRDKLRKATENAMNASKDYANGAIKEAMATSPYSFERGKPNKDGRLYATGKAVESLDKVASKPIEWQGNECVAYIGADLKEAPEALILALGTPHSKADRNLNNAMKVKGKYKKEVSRIQHHEFFNVLKEAQDD